MKFGSGSRFACKDDDFAAPPLYHPRQNRAARIYNAQKICVQGLRPTLQRSLQKSVQRSRNTSRADQHIWNSAIRHADAIDRYGHLLRIGHIAANSQRVAPVLFDLNMCQVEFGFAASDKGESCTEPCEADRQTFPDAPAAAGDQDTFMLEAVCRSSRNPFRSSPDYSQHRSGCPFREVFSTEQVPSMLRYTVAERQEGPHRRIVTLYSREANE